VCHDSRAERVDQSAYDVARELDADGHSASGRPRDEVMGVRRADSRPRRWLRHPDSWMTAVRIVSPSVEEHESLRPPLTAGERQVFAFFNRLLPVEWEIYVQPFLNGLRPDFVLLNPAAGIAVFEIKDWNLEAMSYSPSDGRDDACWRVRDKHGRTFNKKNPIAQMEQYRKEIAELYLPSLLTDNGIAAVTGGVIFAEASGRGDSSPACASPHAHPRRAAALSADSWPRRYRRR
jgi:hypothetical protein